MEAHESSANRPARKPLPRAGRGLLSILISMLGCESRQECQEGHSAKDAANRMKPAPSPQETARFFGVQVQFLALQPLVRRKNDNKCKRNNQQEKRSTDKPGSAPLKPPDGESRKRADQGEWSLHQGASLVAGPPFRHRQGRPTRNSCRVLNKIDVNGGAEEDARSERCNHLQNHASVYAASAVKQPTTHAPIFETGAALGGVLKYRPDASPLKIPD
jgi:hypothetical protein